METWKKFNICAWFLFALLLPIQLSINGQFMFWHKTVHKMSYNQANTSSNSNLSDTTVLNCSTYLWKRFPGQDFYHFFHDMQAIIMAIANLQHTMNASITNCKNITMIVSKQKRFNYKQSVYKQLFKFHRISHEQYIASPNSTYECGYHYSGIYFNDKNYVKSQFQQYIIHKLSLKMSLNPTDILIIDR
eukprot:847093_1